MRSYAFCNPALWARNFSSNIRCSYGPISTRTEWRSMLLGDEGGAAAAVLPLVLPSIATNRRLRHLRGGRLDISDFALASVPVNIRNQCLLLFANAIAVLHQVVQHDFGFHFDAVRRFVSQIEQVLVVGLVVVLFRFEARILQILNFNGHPKLGGNAMHFVRQLGHVVHFLELIENAVLAGPCRIFKYQRQALHRVAEREKAAPLMSAAKWRQG